MSSSFQLLMVPYAALGARTRRRGPSISRVLAYNQEWEKSATLLWLSLSLAPSLPISFLVWNQEQAAPPLWLAEPALAAAFHRPRLPVPSASSTSPA